MKQKEPCVVVWFRRNLRVLDNRAFFEAINSDFSVIPLFIFDPTYYPKTYGVLKRWWLHQNLVSLEQELKKRKVPLIIQKGDIVFIFKKIFSLFEVQAVLSHYTVEPQLLPIEQKIRLLLDKKNIPLSLFHDTTLFDPSSIATKSGTPYLKFAAFKRAVFQTLLKEINILPAIKKNLSLLKTKTKISGISITKLRLLSKNEDYSYIKKLWPAGEQEAKKRLSSFIKNNLKTYHKTRDFPALKKGTSRLSSYLSLGVISPHTVVIMVRDAMQKDNSKKTGGTIFLTELLWREFAHHLLYHFPQLHNKSYKRNFDQFAWEKNKTYWRVFTQAKTGYPIIDAGIRELYQTGWMHNRVRMIVASFLTKDLFIPWQEGERWMFSHLIDADTASNVFNWQWVFGSGVDAAPYFRIFNPTTQGETYDKDEIYIRQYLTELDKIYPDQIVDHSIQRDTAMKKFKAIKKGKRI